MPMLGCLKLGLLSYEEGIGLLEPDDLISKLINDFPRVPEELIGSIKLGIRGDREG